MGETWILASSVINISIQHRIKFGTLEDVGSINPDACRKIHIKNREFLGFVELIHRKPSSFLRRISQRKS